MGKNDSLHKKIEDLIKDPNLRSSVKIEIILGQPGNALVENAAENGVDIRGFSHSIDNFFINHALNNHGNEETEKSRGNIPISNEDIKKIPDILQSPDYIIYGGRTKTGNKAIVFAKNINSSAVFEEEVRNGKMRLAAQTLYKLPRTIDVSFIKNAPELYAHSDPGTIKIVDVQSEIVKNLIFRADFAENGNEFKKIKRIACYDSQVVIELKNENKNLRRYIQDNLVTRIERL